MPARIIPWRKFLGSLIPNWLLRRPEVPPGAKLAYARLCQYAGEDGRCFPKQTTLAAELGVSERTANKYIRTLVRHRLIEVERLGLARPNSYFFLDHPWMHELPLDTRAHSEPNPQPSSSPDPNHPAAVDQQEPSAPLDEENQSGRESAKTKHTHQDGVGIPSSVAEALKVARMLGVEESFARQEYHAKKAVDWRDGYGNRITSWADHLQARWPMAQTKRKDRGSTRRPSGKHGPQPPRHFDPADYNQPTKDF